MLQLFYNMKYTILNFCCEFLIETEYFLHAKKAFKGLLKFIFIEMRLPLQTVRNEPGCPPWKESLQQVAFQ